MAATAAKPSNVGNSGRSAISPTTRTPFAARCLSSTFVSSHYTTRLCADAEIRYLAAGWFSASIVLQRPVAPDALTAGAPVGFAAR